jgi:hypothetical protein
MDMRNPVIGAVFQRRLLVLVLVLVVLPWHAVYAMEKPEIWPEFVKREFRALAKKYQVPFDPDEQVLCPTILGVLAKDCYPASQVNVMTKPQAFLGTKLFMRFKSHLWLDEQHLVTRVGAGEIMLTINPKATRGFPPSAIFDRTQHPVGRLIPPFAVYCLVEVKDFRRIPSGRMSHWGVEEDDIMPIVQEIQCLD